MKQRMAAAIPFFYTRVGNKAAAQDSAARNRSRAPESDMWNKIFWIALQNILLDPYGTPIKASTCFVPPQHE